MLKIVLIALGAVIAIFLGLVFLGVWALSGNEHLKKQRCAECGRKAKYLDSEVEKLKWSYADAIHARYQCPKGHVFNKTWRTTHSFED